jgi:peptide-methionine (R)-S-oxide reductase
MFRHRNKIGEPHSGEQQAIYACSCCGTVLFKGDKKFSVGSGFPSFWAHIGQNVKQRELNTYGRNRLQLLCNGCGQHLGHLFDDNRTPSNMRYCINAEAIGLKE